MDLASQAELAVRLVNTAADPAQDRELFAELASDQPFAAGPLTAQDIHWLAMLRSELAEVFAAAACSEAAAVDRLNMLLAAHPLRPVIVRHGDRGWHWHVSDGGSVSDRYAAAAVAGLATVVTTLGVDRLGRCARSGCARVFIDSGGGKSRRHCADHAGTRSTVTAIPA